MADDPFQLVVSVEGLKDEKERFKVWVPPSVFTELGENELPPLSKCLCLPLTRGGLRKNSLVVSQLS